MKNLIKIVAAAALAVVLTQTVQAVPITGTIGFSGAVVTDASTAPASTLVSSWVNNVVNLNDGTFASLSSAATVILHNPWSFNSGAISSFWVITDGANTYTFNLASSSVFSTSATSITIVLAGTVLSNIAGLSPSAFTGSFTLQNPSSNLGNNQYKYTSSISFGSVPDGGTTVLLLGSALSGLALIRRKLAA
ncbi:MAG: VPDSG-CTERM sorting domain-containing protein [Verrucomicrobia bacterium]|nr:VPDSG-CTERM sorting domain-containing protein [Verrucomicrobiota bacterium]